MVTEEYVYCLQGKLGFLCDTDWDGDSFTASPINAYQYDEPRTDGRGNETYTCRRIKIITTTYEAHLPSDVITVQVGSFEKKTKYKCKCARCGMSTRTYAQPKNATDKYASLMGTACAVQTWEFA